MKGILERIIGTTNSYKAIIALGSLATGSILGGRKQAPKTELKETK